MHFIALLFNAHLAPSCILVFFYCLVKTKSPIIHKRNRRVPPSLSLPPSIGGGISLLMIDLKKGLHGCDSCISISNSFFFFCQKETVTILGKIFSNGNMREEVFLLSFFLPLIRIYFRLIP